MKQKATMPTSRDNWLDFEAFCRRHVKVEVQEFPNSCLECLPPPPVSVLIITYQHKPYIQNAIESVLKQKTDFDFEILIGDDQSTDGTLEICKQYAAANPSRIRLFLHKRENNIKVLGQPCGIFQLAYNLFKCRGRFIAMLSGDDEWLSEHKLQKQVEFLLKAPGIAMTYTPHLYRFSNGQIKEENAPDSYPKASSTLYRNFFQRLPEELLHTISEDEVMKAIAMQHGSVSKTPDAGKILVNITGNNLCVGNEKLDHTSHYMNTARILYKLFGDSDRRFKRSYAFNMAHHGISPFQDPFRKDFRASPSLGIYYLFYKIREFFYRKPRS